MSIKQLGKKNLGGCIISNNIITGKGVSKWCFREQPINKNDNGWRFLSNIDTEEYINNAENLAVYDFNSMIEIEPAVLAIYELPVSTDLVFEIKNGKRNFYDTVTGEKVKFK